MFQPEPQRIRSNLRNFKMPENARVFIAEDNNQLIKVFERNLSRAGHVIVSTTTSLKDALDAIKRFEELNVQIAVLDANLSPDDESGNDGRSLVEAINRLSVDVKTIGMSSSKMEGVTIDLGKRNYSDLATVITNL